MTNHGSADRIQAINGPRYAAKYLKNVWCDWLNQPQIKLIKDDGDLWPRRTPCPPHQPNLKWSVICKSRRSYDFRCHDGVKGGHPYGTNFHLKLVHQIVLEIIHLNQDVVTLKDIFPQITLRANKSSNRHRKRGVHHGGTEHLWCTTTPPEEHHKSIDSLNIIMWGMQTQSY